MAPVRNTPLFIPDLLVIVAGFVWPADRLAFILTSHEFHGVGAKVFTPDPGALEGAYQADNVFLVARLLKVYPKHIDPTIDNSAVLQWATRKGHASIVELILADERVPNIHKNRALFLASANDHTSVVSLLLNDGRSEPALFNSRALFWASYSGHADVVSLLLNDGHSNTADRNKALEVALRRGHGRVAALLGIDTAKKYKMKIH